MRRLLTPLAVGLVAALAVPLGAGSAHAASVRVNDPVGDVRTVVTDDDGNVVSETDAPGARPDVTSISLAHTKRVVQVRLITTGLRRPTDDQALLAALSFEGGNGQRRDLSVIGIAPRPFGGITELVRASNGRTVCPKAVTARIDYAKGTVTASFPRRCIGSPGRVRVSGGLVLTTLDDDVSNNFDDALRNGGSADGFGARSTPWAKRG